MHSTSLELAPTHRRSRRRVLVALFLGATLAAVGAGASSLAYFTDSASNAGSWTSGSIKLGLTPVSTVWTATNIVPGDSGRQTVNVANTGVSQLRYAMATAVSGVTKALDSQLTLAVSSGACPAAGTAVSGDIYSGPLTGSGFGSLATHTGRALDGGTNENLCFSWAFNSAAGNAFQSGAATATFNFLAEQTANNP